MLAAVSLLAGLTLVTAVPAQAGTLWWSSPYARQVTQAGDQDLSPWHIEHVYELQRRLSRLGLYTIWPTGYYGSKTVHAVKQFQRKSGLPVTGKMDRASWRKLIKRTIRGRGQLPDVCRSRGWHACYDRAWHQLTLFHRGEMINSWMVRGGAYDTQTRIGDFTVYARVRHAVSYEYDDAPMPYSLFFDGGEALHGSRYMVDPYVGHSHGCVNLYVKDARQLWKLTEGHVLHVHVYGAWD
jgi:hypothetical protein